MPEECFCPIRRRWSKLKYQSVQDRKRRGRHSQDILNLPSKRSQAAYGPTPSDSPCPVTRQIVYNPYDFSVAIGITMLYPLDTDLPPPETNAENSTRGSQANKIMMASLRNEMRYCWVVKDERNHFDNQCNTHCTMHTDEILVVMGVAFYQICSSRQAAESFDLPREKLKTNFVGRLPGWYEKSTNAIIRQEPLRHGKIHAGVSQCPRSLQFPTILNCTCTVQYYKRNSYSTSIAHSFGLFPTMHCTYKGRGNLGGLEEVHSKEEFGKDGRKPFFEKYLCVQRRRCHVASTNRLLYPQSSGICENVLGVVPPFVSINAIHRRYHSFLSIQHCKTNPGGPDKRITHKLFT